MDTPHVYGSSVTLRQLHSRSRSLLAYLVMLLGAFALSSCVRSLCDGGGCEEASFTGSLQPSSSLPAVSASVAMGTASMVPTSVGPIPSASAAMPPVACATNEDCDGRFCSTEHVCVECESNADCEEVRGLTGRDVSRCIEIVGSPAQNRCVACLEDAHCDEGEKCDGSGTCAPCDSVARDGAFAGCDPDQVCLAGLTPDANQCVECRNSDDCGEQKCELLTHTCAPCVAATGMSSGAPDASALVDEGCGDDKPPRCLAGATLAENSCVQCLTNDDCGGDVSECDPVSHQCVACLSVTDEAQTSQLDASTPLVSIDRGCGEATPRCLVGNAPESGEPNVAPLGDSAANDGGINDASSNAAAPGMSDLDDGGMPEETRECVECLDDRDCPETEVCDPRRHACVQCVTSAHCGSSELAQCDTSSGICVPCDAGIHSEDGVNPDCAHLGGKDVCVAGVCSECTGEFPAACGPDVCDDRPSANEAMSPTQFTCTTIEMRTASACEECVSDAQCQPGQACVLTTFQGGASVGYYCLYRQVAAVPPGYNAADDRDAFGVPDCVEAPPYVNAYSTDSVSGLGGTFCAPLQSTCAALADYRAIECEVAADCGAPDVADATCSPWGQGQQLRCSPLCVSDDDCPRDANGVTFGCSSSGSCAFE